MEVTRQGHESLVVLNKSELEGWRETVHLLSNPADAAWRRESIGQAGTGEAPGRSLVEP